MRKSIIVVMGLALSLAGTAAAQAGAGAAPRERGGSERGGRGMQGGPDGLLLKDITLTEGQRAQIAQLRKTQREGTEAQRTESRTRGEAMRTARQRGDTAAVQAAMRQTRQAMEKERAAHIAAVRAILTVEQQAQFDRNVAELQARMAERGERGARGARGARPGPGGSAERGVRPARGGRPARG